MDEEFLVWWENQLALAKRRLDGFWDKDPVLEVKKRDETVRPVGTVGELFQRKKVGIMDVEKSVYDDEQRKIEERISRLEKLLMPFETESFKKLKYGTTFDVGMPRQRVSVQEQPKVQKLDAVVNETIRAILRNQYSTVGADGRVYVKQNVPLMLKQTAKKMGVR